MTPNKFVHVLPLSMIGLACVVIAAKLAVEDKSYGAFLAVGGLVAYWTSGLLEKIGGK